MAAPHQERAARYRAVAQPLIVALLEEGWEIRKDDELQAYLVKREDGVPVVGRRFLYLSGEIVRHDGMKLGRIGQELVDAVLAENRPSPEDVRRECGK